MKEMFSKDSSPLNNIEYDSNNCNDKKNVYDSSGTVCKESDCPCDKEDNCDDPKKISHDFIYLIV
jgi:hypothetical protein